MKERLSSVARAHERLRAAAQGFDDDHLRAATCLPGWSRGHVLAHLATLASAFARQADHAVLGRVIEVYDGGRQARAAAIERGAALPARKAQQALAAGLASLEAAWAGLSSADWDRPVAYRDSTLLATQLCWWREVEIHSVDLDIGYRAADWDPGLSAHVVSHLLPRLSPAFRLTAEDTGRRWRHGPDDAVELRGNQGDLAAWLAGREAAVPPTLINAVGPLPELGPWP